MFSAAMIDRRSTLLGTGAVLLAAGLSDQAQAVAAGVFEDVRRHGARGDGVAIDSPAINRAIEAAAKRGSGTVVVPAGRYLCFTLGLRDNIALVLSAGATIVAADPDSHGAHYDPPENYMEEQFQDFGITHVHNSLIRGDGVSNVAILGPGMLHGLGLDREGPGIAGMPVRAGSPRRRSASRRANSRCATRRSAHRSAAPTRRSG
ncbi:glycosyl hydrolase family 28-related protein [Sphingomonas sp. 7/4-4]|uniref:glycosyl hydrolase family 28-related protein n=1 Tax=Sphingomonas sp. 7/4-4 TaxID=3018446 RepID=UPI0022F3CCE6|nr:glycosyl hydrolase family 28-related protein [Sphingomonas sp. 7/4-4]WBY07867.1 glycosyl hydrolase family 28-related protein [Sphingomonas sp. 7/4-4]